MYLNAIEPAIGSTTKARRVGRGIGSTLGKTCGKGHKGQKARSGGFHKRGFEGGQMPYQMRLPKFGFTSRKSLHRAKIRLSELNKVNGDVVDLLSLQQAKLVTPCTKLVKIFLSGKLNKAVTVRGIPVSQGAIAAIEAAGGQVVVD